MGRRRKSGQHLPLRVYLHHGAYWYVDRAGDWHKLGTAWDAAAKRQWATLSETPDTYGTVGWWLDAFLVHREALVEQAKIAQRTYDDNVEQAPYLKAFFGKMSPLDVAPDDVSLYLERRGAHAPVRANREKALLSALFSWLLVRSRESGVKVNPCRGVKRLKETKRDRIIEDAEYTKFLERARKSKRSQAVARLAIMIYRTAQRPEDLLRATPRCIRTIQHEGRDTKVLRIQQQKTGAAVDIIIAGELDRVLQECMGSVVELGQPFICTARGKGFSYDGIAAMFRRHVVGCELDAFGPYDLRGKAATDLYRDGESLERIQQLLGHDSVTTTEIYIKARLPQVTRANLRAVESGK